ncbi:hypothetical protein IWW50_001329 [Coemansia erecta]|nr:hypothetical protein IWW50_001329 [Coemansia erecta]
MKSLYFVATVLLAATVRPATAQFAFDVENKEQSEIYNDIKALWSNWAAIGNQVLARAKAGYPDAYAQLTSVYGATSLPAGFDQEMALHAAGVLAQSAQLTVWDKDAGDHAAYSFEVKDVEQGVVATTVVPATLTGIWTDGGPTSVEKDAEPEESSEKSSEDSPKELSSEDTGSLESSESLEKSSESVDETLDELDSDMSEESSESELESESETETETSGVAAVRPAIMLTALAGVILNHLV